MYIVDESEILLFFVLYPVLKSGITPEFANIV